MHASLVPLHALHVCALYPVVPAHAQRLQQIRRTSNTFTSHNGTCMHAHASRLQTYAYVRKQMHAHAAVRAYARVGTQTHTCTCMHANAHMHMHAHKHTHVRTHTTDMHQAAGAHRQKYACSQRRSPPTHTHTAVRSKASPLQHWPHLSCSAPTAGHCSLAAGGCRRAVRRR